MDELRQLEQKIAYHAARSDIECMCKGQVASEDPLLWWYDTTTAETEEEKEFVAMAVRYLELREQLLRHPENAALVRPLNVEPALYRTALTPPAANPNFCAKSEACDQYDEDSCHISFWGGSGCFQQVGS